MKVMAKRDDIRQAVLKSYRQTLDELNVNVNVVTGFEDMK